jgi:hypothetical protein
MECFSNSSITHGTNLRKNNGTYQTSSVFKNGTLEKSGCHFLCQDPFLNSKNTLTILSIIVMWKTTF